MCASKEIESIKVYCCETNQFFPLENVVVNFGAKIELDILLLPVYKINGKYLKHRC